MKFVKEFRNPKSIKKLIKEINELVQEEISIMEVCGTHTMAIFKSGIRELLPSKLKLISGPGCPVCVTPQSYIDTAIQLLKREDIIITTFGDMIKVPGKDSSLRKEKALGRDIRMVYSPLDSLKIAEENPDKEVVFLGVGFETTAPTIALSVKLAHKKNIKNYSVLQSIKTMPNTMKQLILDDEVKINGFICPGHVSSVIGVKPFEFLAKDFNIPSVVAGFESGDIAIALYKIIKMINEKEYNVKNVYGRLVNYEGNSKALEIIDEVFQKTDSNWRGLGTIKNTGLRLKSNYSLYDAEEKLNLKMVDTQPNKECICGDILKGKKIPLDCKLFGKACNPINPIGACMVSEEGTCAAYYKYNNVI